MTMIFNREFKTLFQSPFVVKNNFCCTTGCKIVFAGAFVAFLDCYSEYQRHD